MEAPSDAQPQPQVQGGPDAQLDGPQKNQRSHSANFDKNSISDHSPAMAAEVNFTEVGSRTQEAAPGAQETTDDSAMALAWTPEEPTHRPEEEGKYESPGRPRSSQDASTPQRSSPHPHWGTHNTQHSPNGQWDSPQDGRSEYRNHRHMLTPTQTPLYMDTPPRVHDHMGNQLSYQQAQGQMVGPGTLTYSPHRPSPYMPASRMLNFDPLGGSPNPQQVGPWGQAPPGLPPPSSHFASFTGMENGAGPHMPPGNHLGWAGTQPQQQEQAWGMQGPPPFPPLTTPQHTNNQPSGVDQQVHTGQRSQGRRLASPDKLSIRILNDTEDFDLAILSQVVHRLKHTHPGLDADGPIGLIREEVGRCLNSLGVTRVFTGSPPQNTHHVNHTTPQQQSQHKEVFETEGKEGTEVSSSMHDAPTSHNNDQQVDPLQEGTQGGGSPHNTPQPAHTTQVDGEGGGGVTHNPTPHNTR